MQIPKLIMEYGLPFDFEPSGEVPREMADWCHAMAPKFEQLWNERGSQLLKPIVKRFNRGFKRNELSVYLVAHKRAVSMSHPLMVNIRRNVPTDYSHEILVPGSFINPLFHEMMHRYVVDHADVNSPPSPLFAKYQDETDSAKFHIHIMALLTFGFKESGREADLQKMIEVEKTIPDPGYARAREIERTEGTEVVLDDLEQLFSLTKK